MVLPVFVAPTVSKVMSAAPKKKIVVVAAAAGAPPPPPPSAGWAAGVLPVAARAGVPVALLGLDARSKGGKWSDFAGGGEPEDPTPAHTALRELAEETGGALALGHEELRAALRFSGVTPSGKALHRYVVKIQYDEMIPARFSGSKNDEKVALAWFPLHSLPPLRRAFDAQMRLDNRAISRYAAAAATTPPPPSEAASCT